MVPCGYLLCTCDDQGLRRGFSTPSATLSMRDAPEAKDGVTSSGELIGDINKPISKLVPFALGEERWDPSKASSYKANSRPGSQ